jgi:DNA-binding transcriptional MerR regulator
MMEQITPETPPAIPVKSLYKAEEICAAVGIKPYILRFWESEFDQIAPIISSSGQKLYEPKDLDALRLIKQLLYEKKLTIPKAKMALHQALENEEDLNAPEAAAPSAANPEIALSSDELAEHTFAGVTWPPLVLKEAEIQKLILAKAKLEGIISLTQEIQEKHPPL